MLYSRLFIFLLLAHKLITTLSFDIKPFSPPKKGLYTDEIYPKSNTSVLFGGLIKVSGGMIAIRSVTMRMNPIYNSTSPFDRGITIYSPSSDKNGTFGWSAIGRVSAQPPDRNFASSFAFIKADNEEANSTTTAMLVSVPPTTVADGSVRMYYASDIGPKWNYTNNGVILSPKLTYPQSGLQISFRNFGSAIVVDKMVAIAAYDEAVFLYTTLEVDGK